MAKVTTQTWLERLVSFIKRRVGLEKDFDTIVAPITKITNDLEALALKQRERSNREIEAAAQLIGQSQARKEAASQALAFAAALPGATTKPAVEGPVTNAA